jgi:hypothetical protein
VVDVSTAARAEWTDSSFARRWRRQCFLPYCQCMPRTPHTHCSHAAHTLPTQHTNHRSSHPAGLRAPWWTAQCLERSSRRWAAGERQPSPPRDWPSRQSPACLPACLPACCMCIVLPFLIHTPQPLPCCHTQPSPCRVRFIVSGGAPLAPHVEDFCNVCMAPLLQASSASCAGRCPRCAVLRCAASLQLLLSCCGLVLVRGGPTCRTLLGLGLLLLAFQLPPAACHLQGYGLTETTAGSFVMLPNPKMAYTGGRIRRMAGAAPRPPPALPAPAAAAAATAVTVGPPARTPGLPTPLFSATPPSYLRNAVQLGPRLWRHSPPYSPALCACCPAFRHAFFLAVFPPCSGRPRERHRVQAGKRARAQV